MIETVAAVQKRYHKARQVLPARSREARRRRRGFGRLAIMETAAPGRNRMEKPA
ncbi:MAG: hypothetical protein IPG77_02815 [Betaproteobacteria bacterium]|jgi:hypothetical protein|nr:hypothetical protein [Betaproteobacteria bacterium]MBK8106173.1 hypothetical protein [Betaproteobacteria bacterium]